MKNNISSEITEKDSLDYIKAIILPSFDYCTKELKQYLGKKCNLKTVFYSPFKLDKIIKVEILHKEKNWKKRCVVEMVYIKKQNNGLNKITDIDALPSVYTTVLNKI